MEEKCFNDKQTLAYFMLIAINQHITTMAFELYLPSAIKHYIREVPKRQTVINQRELVVKVSGVLDSK